MKTKFTEKQQQAIDLREKNILVSAAAGSGKTAVLVERIIQLISEGEHPADIDRLLIVTYTNAAAGEMRERITAAIGEKLREEPENEHLQRQSALIHNAHIATIHSFCLFVIRNHFQEIGLDPSFRVADEGEITLLMQDVLEEVLEETFDKLEKAERESKDKITDAPFKNLVEAYSTGKNETVLEQSILSLYRFAMSYPWPEEWLREHGSDYDVHSSEELKQSSFMQYAVSYLKNILPELAEQLRLCKQICEEPDGPYMYGENIEKSLEALENAAGAERFFDFGEKIDRVGFDRLSSKKDDSVSTEKRERVKQLRNSVKKQLEQLKEQFFLYSEEAVLDQCRKVSPVVIELTELVILFMTRLSEKKRDKNLIDFSDMEHLALKILCRKKEGAGKFSIEPTEAALELRDYFQEIMIDEYQDSNLVQECILRCISGEDEGRYNRFMVGDVKQSIYKFRLARPELFMEKFYQYSETEGPCRRIDLSKNFRSRTEVIDSVNLIFSQLFAKDMGGITYDDSSRLHFGAEYYVTEAGENKESVDSEQFETVEDKNKESADSKQFMASEGKKWDSRCTGEYENRTELLMIEKSEDSGKDAAVLEAEAIALRIKQLLRGNKIFDKESSRLRPIQYRDIVILLRSGSGMDEVFQEVLAKQEIPCYISSKTGYFQTSEVQTILQLLRVIDNPLQDISLFGVLKSCFGGFQDEELAKIAASFPGKQKLYKKIKEYADLDGTLDNTDRDERLREKCRSFLQWYEELRRCTVWLSVRELLEKIIEKEHYLEYVTALPGGAKRRANVEMLLQKAANFEKTSYKGLYHFIRYIDRMDKYSIDVGEAGTVEESADVVRIMTIHKSKGLEFPVCIVAGTGRRINRRDASAPILTDMDMGVAVDFIDPVLRVRSKTLRKAVLARKILLDSQAEELRILYVALTRAKEKLIITGVINDAEKELTANLTVMQRKDMALPYSFRSSASRYLDFVLACAMRTEGMGKLFEQYDSTNIRPSLSLPDVLSCRVITEEEIQGGQLKQEIEEIRDAGRFERKLKETVIDEALREKLNRRFGFSYPHEALQKLYPKVTVSELKLAAIRGMAGEAEEGFLEEEQEIFSHLFEEETVVPYLPAFLKEEEQEDKISGAARGSAVHRIMELVDFRYRKELAEKDGKDALEKKIQEWQDAGLLSEYFAKAVNRKKIMHFMESSLAERMEKAALADKLWKEQPFMLGIDAKRLAEDFPETEQVLVQGIIDVFFEEEDEIVLLDYKTDVIKTSEELADRYRVQLDYYAEALERITGKKVKEKILYSFYLEEEITT